MTKKRPDGRNGDPAGQRLATPRWFIKHLEDLGYEIGLDVCADFDNAVCGRHYTEEDNGLTRSWKTRPDSWAWCNPPFSDIKPWARRADLEALYGNRVLVLTPCRPETAWFYRAAVAAAKCSVIKPRLNYLDTVSGEIKQGVNFASCLWEFRPLLTLAGEHPVLRPDGSINLHYMHATRPKGAI